MQGKGKPRQPPLTITTTIISTTVSTTVSTNVTTFSTASYDSWFVGSVFFCFGCRSVRFGRICVVTSQIYIEIDPPVSTKNSKERERERERERKKKENERWVKQTKTQNGQTSKCSERQRERINIVRACQSCQVGERNIEKKSYSSYQKRFRKNGCHQWIHMYTYIQTVIRNPNFRNEERHKDSFWEMFLSSIFRIFVVYAYLYVSVGCFW